MKRLTILINVLVASSLFSYAQVQLEPAQPSTNDDITVYFDASGGNEALAGFSGTIYAHTCLLYTSDAADD